MQGKNFCFDGYSFDEGEATLRLRYSYEDGPEFTETILFPEIPRALGPEDRTALNKAFRLIFLLAGASYYKAYAPEHLVCKSFNLDRETAAFVEKVYRKGLAEFAYRNKLDLRGRVNFVAGKGGAPAASRPELDAVLCIPVGGGKDSVVSIETLRQSDKPLRLFALTSMAGIAEPIAACIAESGLPAVSAQREISPALLDLNKSGAYNGHVPVTAILSAIAVATCIMQGWDTLVMSNERSANAPNLLMGDLEVNHQYSKSFEFEQDFSGYVKQHVAANLSYFSLLRPLSETAITRKFARLEEYHPVFRSCNTAFRQDAAQRNKHWCRDCPKCRFVFLALAPFMEKRGLAEIFGGDMLDDTAQADGFADLCGLGAHKPFECVGETGESALLIQKLARMPEWRDSLVVRQLAPRLAPAANFDREYQSLFEMDGAHQVPPEYAGMLSENL
jgi:hypothetical protein